MNITVHVTHRDIINGQGSSWNCPIARALDFAAKRIPACGPGWYVGNDAAGIIGSNKKVMLPLPAVEFVELYDRKHANRLRPFKFQISIPFLPSEEARS